MLGILGHSAFSDHLFSDFGETVDTRIKVLVTRMQFDLVKDRVVRFAAFWYTRSNSLTRLAFYIEPHLAPPATKRLLLARIALAQRRMAMLCTGLTGYHDKLFCTVTIIVDINDKLQTCALQFAQAEVNHLDLRLFLRCQYNTSLS